MDICDVFEVAARRAACAVPTAVPLAVSVRLQCLPNLFPTFVTHPRESEHSSRTLSESGVCRPKFAPEHSKKVVRRKRG